MRVIQKNKISGPETSVLLGKKRLKNALFSAFSLRPFKVPIGHNHDENQVSKTSGSCSQFSGSLGPSTET